MRAAARLVQGKTYGNVLGDGCKYSYTNLEEISYENSINRRRT
ncbi:hypothetical protein SAMN03159341_107143 [Paenibacillus sp. 1_12]|nr:hypothetical protein SAMN03159341_107143 [Paenibacillus sp. 1_12]